MEFSTRPSEQLLIDALPRLEARRVVCTTLGRAQFALAAAADSDRQITCSFLDVYQADCTRKATAHVPNLRVWCEPDLPVEEFDAAVFPLTSRGEAELARELLQAGFQSLCIGGLLWATTDNPRDTWLHDELARRFGKVVAHRSRAGVLYVVEKTEPLRKLKDYTCEFAFRDRDRLLKVVSRPGVFSHRRLDTGSRALIETLDVRPGQRVLEIGCGSGPISFAAAARADGVRVLAVDANVRAIACTQRGATLNELAGIVTRLNADAACDEPGTYDLAVTNPPYYSRGRLTEIFLAGAANALRPGGTVQVVTKNPAAIREAMSEHFDWLTVVETRGYAVVGGRKPS